MEQKIILDFGKRPDGLVYISSNAVIAWLYHNKYEKAANEFVRMTYEASKDLFNRNETKAD